MVSQEPYCSTQAKLSLWCSVTGKCIPDYFYWSLPAALSQENQYLGVILYTNLTNDQHITKPVSSVRSYLSQINRTKHVFDKRTLLAIK